MNTSLASDGGALIVFLLLLLGGAALYFLPSMIAIFRGHRNALGLLVLNLFLGWTLVGWVIALVWSLYQEQAAQPVQHHPEQTSGNPFGRFD